MSFVGVTGGIEIPVLDVSLTADVDITRGQIVAVTASVSTAGQGSNGIPYFSNAKAAVTTTTNTESIYCGIMAVALDDVLSGQTGRFRLRGAVEVLAGFGHSVGAVFTTSSARKTVNAASADNVKIIGYALDAATLDTLGWALFDGLHGFAGQAYTP